MIKFLGAAAGFLLIAALGAGNLGAQTVQESGPWQQSIAGGEEEAYLRALQVGGLIPLYPWSLRNFTSSDLSALSTDAAHPWSGRFSSSPDTLPDGLRVLPFRFDGAMNALFPQGEDDGAAWAGRGFSLAGNFGVEYTTSWLEARVAPTAVWAQNGAFTLGDNGYPGAGAFGDTYYAESIDLPQRFGDEALARLDWGQSTVRVFKGPVEAGLSSANQTWGPAQHYPLILSGDGPGFLHAFVGTSTPVRTPLGSFDAQVQWGELRHSEFSPVEALGDRRLMAGWVVNFQPALLAGLEIGASRFFHQPWPGDTIGYSGLLRPFEAFLAENISEDAGDVNQLASVFGRWAFPESGFEAYVEYGRDDYSYRFRDFLLEPEHTSALLIGAAKSWGGDEDQALWLARMELLGAAPSQIIRFRYAGPFSLHHLFREGHTHLGQPLGSSAAKGGGAARLSLDRYDAVGRWTMDLAREVRGEKLTALWDGQEYPVPLDVLYSFGAGRLAFIDPLEIGVSFRAGYNVERNLQADALNGSLSVTAVYRPR